MGDQAQGVLLEAPRGIYPARLDDKGRLKLPVPFQQYLAAMPEKKLFVTSLDGHIAGVYPISVWRENEKIFEKEDPEKAEDAGFLANDLGADSEMDTQGRVLFPPELRRTLGIENQPVKMVAKRGHLEVMSEAIYEERRQRAIQNAPAQIRGLERAGLR